MKSKIFALVFMSVFTAAAFSQTAEEAQQDVIDYSSIQKALRNDGLKEKAILKKKIVKQIKKEREEIVREKSKYPSPEDFWSFASEMWLVKNAQELKWDAPRPNYGLQETFRDLLEQLGYFNEKFRILVVDTPNIARLGLPSNKGESLLILSLPFMRTLDLSKADISLVLLEDFFRVKEKMFQANLGVDTSFLGTNFSGESFDKTALTRVLKGYSDVAFKKGFSFQQQYEITKKMDAILNSNPELWNRYLQLLRRIDKLVKSNLLFESYSKIYPSPEMQIQWLTPKKKVL